MVFLVSYNISIVRGFIEPPHPNPDARRRYPTQIRQLATDLWLRSEERLISSDH